MTITELSIKRPPLIIVIFLSLILLGIFSYKELSYELLPDVTPPMISVSIVYPGAAPKEVETSVTKIVEDAVNNVEKIKRVNSYSFESSSLVFTEFIQSADDATALQEIQRRVNEIISSLPEECEAPVISKFSLDEMPILRIGAVSEMPGKDFYKFLKEELKPRLSRIEGVGLVSLIGGEEREIKVNIDKKKLNAYDLSALEIVEAIKKSNFDVPAGTVKDEDGQYNVRLTGKFQSVDVIKNLVIRENSQFGKIKVSEVADVFDGTKETVSISRLNKKAAVGIFVQKQSDANAVEVSRLVREELGNIESEYSADNIKFDVAQDMSTFTIESANAVEFDLLIAILMVGLVMLLFLHSIRNSVIIMVAIPCSLISTFVAMYIFNFTLNLMTLLALSLVIGILVDDSIVVLENIYRHLEMGKNKRSAAIEGRNEIGFTALSITLVDVVVFLPLALVGGLIGNLVRQFSLVIVTSTLLSLFVSFTITPMLASRFSKIEQIAKNSLMEKFAAWFERLFKLFTQKYISLLQVSLKHKGLVITIITLLLFSSFSFFPLGLIGDEFFAFTDKGDLQMIIELEPGAKLEKTNSIAAEVENRILSMPEVEKIFSNIGSSEEGFIGSTSNNVAELNITLVPKNERTKGITELGEEFKKIAREYPGVKTRVAPIVIWGSTDASPVAVGINGSNYEDVQKVSKQIEEIFHCTPGTSDIQVSSKTGKPEIQIQVNREKMNSLGLSLDYVGAELRAALYGDNSTKFRDGFSEYDIRVKYDDFDKDNPAEIGNIIFINNDGQKIYLNQFADITYSTGPSKLERRYRNSSITVMSRAVGRAVGNIGDDIKSEINKLKLPAGIKITYENDLETQDEAFGSMGLAFIAAIIFVYLILVALYNSFVYPLSVLLTIPLAIIGALYGLALTMKNLDVMSLLGMIILIGLVGKNTIILVDRINQNRENGMGTTDAIIESARTRLRPILMTTLTLIFGILPIAVSKGAANEIKTGLAIVIIGGLTSSLFLTLILVPIMYTKIEQFREFMIRIKNRLFVGDKDAGDEIPETALSVKAKKLSGITGILLIFILLSGNMNAQILTLSMNDAVDIALKNNRELKISGLTKTQSGEKVNEAYGNLLPEISAEGTYTRNTKLPVFFMPAEFFGLTTDESIPVEISEKNAYEGYLKFRMPVFNNAIYSGIRAAKAEERINIENERNAKSQIITDVKKAYLTVLIAQHQLELVEQSLKRAEQRLNDVKLLFAQGLASEVDTLTAFIGCENILPDKLKLISAVDNTKNNLKFLMGITPGNDIELTDELIYKKETDNFVFSEICSSAIEKRPEVKALEIGIEGAEELKNIEWSSHLPTLSLFGALKIEAEDKSFEFDDYKWPTSSYVGLQLNVPLFSGFKTSSRVEQAEIEKSKTEEQLKNLKDYIFFELKAALSALIETEKNIAVRENTIELAERNYSLTQSRFQKGLSKLSDLLDAELVLNEAKTNYINEVYNYLIAKTDYEKAAGTVIAQN
ncbi:MAG: efflux RND transporter permease subunit [Ignavibacteria bacterium]|jgi:hydrophobe/amphiphile efflux-1 (HAE1) family protein